MKNLCLFFIFFTEFIYDEYAQTYKDNGKQGKVIQKLIAFAQDNRRKYRAEQGICRLVHGYFAHGVVLYQIALKGERAGGDECKVEQLGNRSEPFGLNVSAERCADYDQHGAAYQKLPAAEGGCVLVARKDLYESCRNRRRNARKNYKTFAEHCKFEGERAAEVDYYNACKAEYAAKEFYQVELFGAEDKAGEEDGEEYAQSVQNRTLYARDVGKTDIEEDVLRYCLKYADKQHAPPVLCLGEQKLFLRYASEQYDKRACKRKSQPCK